MQGAQGYLTQKTRPGRAVRTLEKLALTGLFLLLAACVYVAVYGYMQDGLSVAHLILAAVAVVIALVMNPIAERMRRRKHAVLIVRALTEAGGWLPCEELEAACGVRKAAQTALLLREKGYLTGVSLKKGLIGFDEALPADEAEEIVPIFRN